jgi:serine phosphatase RsbU (regulator of sigma subunit)
MNPTLRRIRWRLFWMSFIALSLGIGSFVLSNWAYPFSDDQCRWSVEGQKVIIREVLPDGVAEQAGILDGDELIAIQGKPTKASRTGINEAQRFINSKEEGTVLLYAVRRGDRDLQMPVRMVKPLDLYHLALVISGIVTWMIGLIVAISAAERKSARHFFYLSCLSLLAAATGINFAGNAPVWFKALLVVSIGLNAALLPPIWVHFFLRFPYPFQARKSRRLLLGLYGGFAIVGLLLSLVAAFQLFLPELQSWFLEFAISLSALQRLGQIINGLVGIAILGAFIAGLVLFVRGTFKVPERVRQVLFPCLVFTSAVLIDLVAERIIATVFNGSLLYQRNRWFFLLPLPLLPLSFGYAIIRHGLFDVRRALLRGVGYFVTLVFAVGLYLGALSWIFSKTMGSVPTGWAGALLGLMALPVGWALRSLIKRIRRRFRRDIHSTREIVLGSLRETKRRLSEEALLKSFEDALREGFRPQVLMTLPVVQGEQGFFITLPVKERQRYGIKQSFPSESLKLPPSLLRQARENMELVLGLGSEEADWIREQGVELRDHVDATEAQLLVLLMVDEKPHSAVLLGGKYAELSYGREDRELLREAAIAAGGTLEAAVMHRRVMAQERLSQELETARKIQESLICSHPPSVPGFQVALRLEPALETGGDLLFVKRRPSGKWLAAVGDISGKGLAAALYMAQATALLEQATQQEDRPLAAILESMDHTLRQLLGSNGFLTLVLMEWDENGRYLLARAGHPGALLLCHKDESVQEILPKGRGLGLRPAGPCDWQIIEGVLPPNGWIVLYSDGLTEAMNRHGELYGLDRFHAQLQRLRGTGSVRAACEAVFKDVAAFDTQNRDDRTLFILGRETAA